MANRSEQNSKRHSVRLRRQREATARDPYAVIPPTRSISAAFAKSQEAPRDAELSLFYDERLHKAKENKTRGVS
jgi:hypothetical protein